MNPNENQHKPQDPVQPPSYRPPTPAIDPVSNHTQIATPTSVQPHAPSAADDPGRTMAIIGIVLAFFFSIVGLIVSIIGLKKSRKSGFPGTLAIIGIVLNSVFIVFGLLLIGLTILAFNGIQQQAREARSATTARQEQLYAQAEEAQRHSMTRPPVNQQISETIAKKLHAYDALQGSMPSTVEQLSVDGAIALTDTEKEAISPVAVDSDNPAINIVSCENDTGIYIEYWDSAANSVAKHIVTPQNGQGQQCTIMPLN